jgi:hypothetical protein
MRICYGDTAFEDSGLDSLRLLQRVLYQKCR